MAVVPVPTVIIHQLPDPSMMQKGHPQIQPNSKDTRRAGVTDTCSGAVGSGRGFRASPREGGTLSMKSMGHMWPVAVSAVMERHQVRSWEGSLEEAQSERPREGREDFDSQEETEASQEDEKAVSKGTIQAARGWWSEAKTSNQN